MSLGVQNGVTYYSDLQNMQSISTPVIDNGVRMGHKGHFDINWDKYTVDFDSFGYGLKKTRANQGSIFCDDASKLFGLTKGYVGMLMNFPHAFYSGTYYPLLQAEGTQEYLLWGVNVGQIRSSMPCVYASLTREGIAFTVWSSYCKYTIVDKYTDISANTNAFFEFLWDVSGLSEYNSSNGYAPTMGIRVDGIDVVLGNPPIANNSLSDLNFYVLETPYVFNNLDCTIKRLVTGNEIPYTIEKEWYSSSSSSSSEVSSSSSSEGIYFTLSWENYSDYDYNDVYQDFYCTSGFNLVSQGMDSFGKTAYKIKTLSSSPVQIVTRIGESAATDTIQIFVNAVEQDSFTMSPGIPNKTTNLSGLSTNDEISIFYTASIGQDGYQYQIISGRVLAITTLGP